MAIKTDVNYPLIRDLQEIGLLSSGSSPNVSGPFKMKTEAFAGDSSGGTKTLAETPLAGGIFAAFTIPTGQASDNTLTALTEDTDFSISGATLTYLTSGVNAKQVLLIYAY